MNGLADSYELSTFHNCYSPEQKGKMNRNVVSHVAKKEEKRP